MSHFHRIGLITGPGVDKPEILEQVVRFLLDQGCQPYLADTNRQLQNWPELPRLSGPELLQQIDLLITIGGDGTLLGAARLMVDQSIPLLGINLGRLGFLADIPLNGMQESLQQILNGIYQEEQRAMLKTEILRGTEITATEYAFNDAVIYKWNSARLIEYETFVNDRLVNAQRSDGMIVSTPTGSTAYALSGGGPLMEPDLDALLLVPISPHTLSNRPIVIKGSSIIELLVVGRTDPANVRVSCDGQEGLEIQQADRIRISRHEHRVRLIHPKGHDHFNILREKLGWDDHPRSG